MDGATHPTERMTRRVLAVRASPLRKQRRKATPRDPVGRIRKTKRLRARRPRWRNRASQGRALEPQCKVGSTSIDPDLPLDARCAKEAWSSSRNSPIPWGQARFEAMCLAVRPQGSRGVGAECRRSPRARPSAIPPLPRNLQSFDMVRPFPHDARTLRKNS
jgi:hypothetical protein